MNKTIFAISVAAFVLAGASAFAGDKSAQEKFSKIDADADGVVTQEEFVAYKTADGETTEADASAAFTQAAGDDGQLTLAELEAAWADKKTDQPG